MKMKSLIFGAAVLTGCLTQAQDNAKSISGIVTTRLVTAGDKTVAFILTNPGDPTKPTVVVAASGADAAALVPRNQVTLVGTTTDGAFGSTVQVKANSVSVGDTNQPFKSQPITAAAFKDASASVGNYVQLAGVTFAAEKFDNSGTAQVKTENGSTVSLLVGKGVAGRETPKGETDVFGVVVKNGGEWKLVAARFLPSNRKVMQELATKATCMTCHNPDARVVAGTPLVGPPYREVAAKYRNDPDAAAKLIAQMKAGGQGKWGSVPMPALAGIVPLEDMQKLADWILSYRWDALLAE